MELYSNAGLTTNPVNTGTAVRMSLSPQYSQQNLTKKMLPYSSPNTKSFSFYIPSPSYTRRKRGFFLSRKKYNKKEIFNRISLRRNPFHNSGLVRPQNKKGEIQGGY
jgi:hypothetical protein